MIFSRNFAEHSRKCWEVLKFSEFLNNSEKFSWILTEFWRNSDVQRFEWFGRSATESLNPGRGRPEPAASSGCGTTAGSTTTRRSTRRRPSARTSSSCSSLSWKIRYRILLRVFSKFHRFSPTCKGYISAVSKPILHSKTHFSAVFEIDKIIIPLHRSKLIHQLSFRSA